MMLSLNQLTISLVLMISFQWFQHKGGIKEDIKKFVQI